MIKKVILFFTLFQGVSFAKVQLQNEIFLQSKNNLTIAPFFETPYKDQGALKARVRSELSYSTSSFHFVLSPQFNTLYKTFGNVEVSQSEINKDNLILHKAFASYEIGRFELSAGKKDLSILKGAMVGSASWTQWNRSYLSGTIRYQKDFFHLFIDYWKANQDERLKILELGRDYEVIDMQLNWNFSWLDELQLAIIYTTKGEGQDTFYHTGLLMQHKLKHFDFFFKSILQKKQTSTLDVIDSLFEGSLGYTWGKKVNHAANISIGLVSKEFNSLTGTGLDFSGHMFNYFGGHNIKKYTVSYKNRISDSIKLGLFSHLFERNDSDTLIINQVNRGFFAGQDGTTTEKVIGKELGILSEFKQMNGANSIKCGYSIFLPGQYFKGENTLSSNHLLWADFNISF
ncbi:MAG: hypothetical protein HN576_01265 [Bacteriovoracaceae bacterium]|jgi:hypothetical protein|nr:hypothetical protein [Bacteriovoracaceae bacterium]